MKSAAHSHSRLQAFSQCPLAYRLQFVDKVPAESSDALEIGSAAHEFFDRWVKAGQPDQILPLAAACFQKDPRQQSNFKEYLEICQTFAREYKSDPAYPRVTTEIQAAFDRQWKPCGWVGSSVMFRAKIDRIESPLEEKETVKKIRITDYKTGFSGNQDSFQLDVYALVASLIYPRLEQVEVEFYYVKSGFKTVKLLAVQDLDITKVQLESLMTRIESETKWKAKPGQRCLNCPVAAACSEKPSDLVQIDSLEVAGILGAEIALLEAQAKAKKKALSVWCRQNGAVPASGLIYDHYPTESMVVQIGPFLSACVAHHVDVQDMLNPDSRAIRKAMKEKAGFADAIAPYIGMDVSTRFYAKKNNDAGD